MLWEQSKGLTPRGIAPEAMFKIPSLSVPQLQEAQ